MDAEKKRKLQAAGWRIGDAADFLDMNDEERKLLDVRTSLALAVRRERETRGLTQAAVAKLLSSSQPRVARIEQAAPDVSLDLMLRAYFALGGQLALRLGSKAEKTRSVRASRTLQSARQPRSRTRTSRAGAVSPPATAGE